ncbi:type II toxin-antitoxin system HicA family toxin [Candidatus Uhrbacteria bacterium]|nr:type II toxin-antitoxin system HicA family toxin [Candidatus Uhrbacteria bacterium]
MPPLSELPSDLSREKLIRALVRLGFVVDRTGGKGSHCKLVWPKSGKAVTVLCHLHKHACKYVIEQAMVISGLEWEIIDREL